MSGFVQNGLLPLHVALKNKAGLEVVAALLEAHHEVASMVFKVRGEQYGMLCLVCVCAMCGIIRVRARRIRILSYSRLFVLSY